MLGERLPILLPLWLCGLSIIAAYFPKWTTARGRDPVGETGDFLGIFKLSRGRGATAFRWDSLEDVREGTGVSVAQEASV